MAFTYGPSGKVWDGVQQGRQPSPVTAKPGVHRHSEHQEDGSPGHHSLPPPKAGKPPSTQIPEPKAEPRSGQRDQVNNSSLLACEHQRGTAAGNCSPSSEASHQCAQNESKRGGDKQGLVNEIP